MNNFAKFFSTSEMSSDFSIVMNTLQIAMSAALDIDFKRNGSFLLYCNFYRRISLTFT
jgi:hypothetical protein